MKANILKKPELIASILMVIWAFTLTAVAFNAPPGGCTPWSCDSPLAIDFDNQTVSVSQAPTASGHVATKSYVDSVVGAAGTNPPGGCELYMDCDSDGYTAYSGDCDETCDTCFAGNTIYKEWEDSDCDGVVSSNKAMYVCGSNWRYRTVNWASCDEEVDDALCDSWCRSSMGWDGRVYNCTESRYTPPYPSAYYSRCGSVSWANSISSSSNKHVLQCECWDG